MNQVKPHHRMDVNNKDIVMEKGSAQIKKLIEEQFLNLPIRKKFDGKYEYYGECTEISRRNTHTGTLDILDGNRDDNVYWTDMFSESQTFSPDVNVRYSAKIVHGVFESFGGRYVIISSPYDEESIILTKIQGILESDEVWCHVCNIGAQERVTKLRDSNNDFIGMRNMANEQNTEHARYDLKGAREEALAAFIKLTDTLYFMEQMTESEVLRDVNRNIANIINKANAATKSRLTWNEIMKEKEENDDEDNGIS